MFDRSPRPLARMLLVAPCLAASLALVRPAPAGEPAARPVAAGSAEKVPSPRGEGPLWVYVGTYTRGDSRGIYLYRFDPASGGLTLDGLAAETVSPSFLALHPRRPWLYAVNEVSSFAGRNTGSISAFAIDPDTGRLNLLGQQSSQGPGPCHLTVDRTGRFVLAANYGGGSVAVLPILPQGGLGPAVCFHQHQGSSVDPKRQQGPHAHSVNLDPANQFAFVADLGLDQLLVYRFQQQLGVLTRHHPPGVALPPGAGPRHFAMHPNGRFAYVINELQSTVTAMRYRADAGTLEILQSISTLPEGYDGENTAAELQVHPSGKFLYGSNRGHDSIVVMAIEPGTGRLRYVENESTRGGPPRNFALDPHGAHLLAANQNSQTLVVFRIDAQTGVLSPVGSPVEAPSPVCLRIMRPLRAGQQ